MKPQQEPAAAAAASSDMEQEDTLRDFVPPLRSKLGEFRFLERDNVAFQRRIRVLRSPCLLCSSEALLLFSHRWFIVNARLVFYTA